LKEAFGESFESLSAELSIDFFGELSLGARKSKLTLLTFLVD
jgi:hypothetical protein